MEEICMTGGLTLREAHRRWTETLRVYRSGVKKSFRARFNATEGCDALSGAWELGYLLMKQRDEGSG
jgi:hypothetical protein